MPDLPAGHFVFLFTDIAGSIKLWEQYPQAMPSALARHDALVRHAVEPSGGRVFKTVGDACYAVFGAAADALAAALAAQHALMAEDWDQLPLRVRVALHAGHGGQILLTRAVLELIGERLPPGVESRDLGERRLRDITRPERIYQVVAPDLPSDFPPLRTLDLRPNNLPAFSTSFIGRERQVAAICALLRRADVRLLTLTGAGGTGKTRLALQVAADLLDDFEHGVFFVSLAVIRDPALVIAAIAQTLGVQENGNPSLVEILKHYLHDRQVLLLLDNFEQAVTAGPKVTELLASAPRLQVMVTSRALLQVYGEREFLVPPLALPDLRRLPPPELLLKVTAVALFAERARAVQADFALTTENAPAVAEICTRLDGLPLAIELAAARCKLFSPQAMLARLTGTSGQSSLQMLTTGARATCRLANRRCAGRWIGATTCWTWARKNCSRGWPCLWAVARSRPPKWCAIPATIC